MGSPGKKVTKAIQVWTARKALQVLKDQLVAMDAMGQMARMV
jgi:hypothetical protein